jgi:glycosyltransferase involved in cell wall biosynthesis
VIRNGVELRPAVEPRADIHRRLALSPQTSVALMLGSLGETKDHDTLLRAWGGVVGALRSTDRDAVLLLAGKAYEEQRLKVLAFDLGMDRRSVRFLGFVDDVAGLIGAADIGVFSSNGEGCPNGVLECMAGGLPVVATDLPGIREAVGATGLPLLVPRGDPSAFAQRVLELIDHPEKARSFGTASRERIENAFSPAQMCAQMVPLLESELGDRH